MFERLLERLASALGACPTLRKPGSYATTSCSCAISWRHIGQHKMLQLPMSDRLLDSADIPYMVIGGQAVLLYGEPRLTKDIDVPIGAHLDRLPDVLALVQSIDL